MAANTEPKTLQEAVVYFANPDNCLLFLAGRRWPDGVVICPRCGSKDVGFIASRRMWQCKNRHPLAQFSIKVGTIFEDSPIGLDKWLSAMWMIASCKNGVSSYEIHRALGVTQKTAWFMLHRIRLAMQDEFTGGNLYGEVEIDETHIGGKVRNMHKDRKACVQRNSQKDDKAIVVGMLERGGKICATVVPDRKKDTMQETVRGNVERGAELHTDEFANFWRMDEEYAHMVVNHLNAYVDGNVHTNGVENFWSCLKRISAAPTSALNRFTCSATLMRRRFATTTASRLAISTAWLSRSEGCWESV